MKVVAFIVGLGLLLYLFAALALLLLQRSFIYFPSPIVMHSFTEKNVEAGEGIRLNLIVANESKREAVIYFGGNAEAVAGSVAEYAEALSDKAIYMVNYRGYGKSEGQPTEEALIQDAQVVYDFVSKNHTKVSVIGRSLGSGVACRLATLRPVSNLVLITPYDSILNIAKSAYPVFPVEYLLKDQYRSVDYAAAINVPVLVILAQNDAVIPAQNSHRLIEAFDRHIPVAVLADTGHNDLQHNAEFYPLISDFLR